MSAYIRCPVCGCETVDVDNPDRCDCDWHTGQPGQGVPCTYGRPGPVLDAKDPELAALLSQLSAALQRAERYARLLKEIRDDYDCDGDAHKYGTSCRACEARTALLPREEFEGCMDSCPGYAPANDGTCATCGRGAHTAMHPAPTPEKGAAEEREPTNEREVCSRCGSLKKDCDKSTPAPEEFPADTPPKRMEFVTYGRIKQDYLCCYKRMKNAAWGKFWNNREDRDPRVEENLDLAFARPISERPARGEEPDIAVLRATSANIDPENLSPGQITEKAIEEAREKDPLALAAIEWCEADIAWNQRMNADGIPPGHPRRPEVEADHHARYQRLTDAEAKYRALKGAR